jgi:sodium-dependent dicarboxylate transporter 2/3/5
MNEGIETRAGAAGAGAPVPGARWRLAALVAAPLLGLAAAFALPDGFIGPDGAHEALSPAARATVGMLVWMALWWVTEAVPIEATALLPVAAFPLLGVAPLPQALGPYASDVIFLFLGGFMLAAAMTRWGLDRRIAYATIGLAGAAPDRVILGVMAATAFVSMWVSNSATAAMMVPIALSLIRLAGDGPQSRRFAIAMLLGVAYAASIGGLGTLIGSPPNGIVARYAEQAWGREISFARWLAVGLPLVVVLLPLTWLLLTRVLERHGLAELGGGRTLVQAARRELGPLSRGEAATLVAFGAAALLWLSRPVLAGLEIAGARPLAGLSDAGIAICAALLLFAWPVDARRRVFALDWRSAAGLPWGVLLLFGGGLSMAAAIEANGVTRMLAAAARSAGEVPELAAIAGIVGASVFLSEVTSNTAQVAATTPVLAAIAPALGVDALHLVVASALGASCAFMMPVGTPPNAIVFGTGRLTIWQMCRAAQGALLTPEERTR